MKRSFLFYLTALLISVPFSVRLQAQEPKAPPLLQTLEKKLAAVTAVAPSDTLTLNQALRLAFEQNPELKTFPLEIRARQAQAVQAGLWKNPELGIESENFAGSGALQGFKSTETTITLSQRIELAGKPSKRVSVAKKQTELTLWQYQSRKLDIFTRVVIAFNKVLAAQKEVALRKEILSLNQEFQAQIAKRVEAGRTSPAALARAQVETARAQVTLLAGQNRLIAAKKELSVLLGGKELSFKGVQGRLEATIALPSLNKLQKLLDQNPRLALWESVKSQRKALYALAKAQAIPDPQISLGWRRLNESGDQAWVAGLSLPLPLFDRNQGAVQEARIRINQTELQKQTERLVLQSQLQQNYQSLVTAQQMIRTLKNRIIPQAQQAFTTINQGYRQGKFGFLDVLDARRTLFSARQNYVQQLAEFQTIRAQIENLIAQSLETVD